MNLEKLCTWLGLPERAWPPDHFVLLGLQPGEGDLRRIEQQVHDRLAKLRAYQISHPDEATEGMNRLAQAFLCLSETTSRKAYERSLGKETNGPPALNEAETGPPTVLQTKPGERSETVADSGPATDWKVGPPPVRESAEGVSSPTTSPGIAEAKEPPRGIPADPVYEAAFYSPEARRGLGTLRALCERIDLTRELFWSWDKAGRFLSKPQRLCRRAADVAELTRRLDKIFELLESFPPILGQPGQPGYRVVSMARLEMAAQLFQMMDVAQRQAVARDWLAGRTVLAAHRRLLRQELKTLRRQGILAKLSRAVRTALNDHPFLVFSSVIALVAFVLWIYFR